jgi:hypothetical protein
MNENMNQDPIASWIVALDETGAEMLLHDLDAQIQALHEKRKWIVDALALKKRWTQAQSPQATAPSNEPSSVPSQPRMIPVPDAHIPLDFESPPRGKTAAVLRILGSEPDREWSTQAIRDMMVERDWMTTEDKDYASLMSTLSRMSTDSGSGQMIYRPSRGHYRLSPPTGT